MLLCYIGRIMCLVVVMWESQLCIFDLFVYNVLHNFRRESYSYVKFNFGLQKKETRKNRWKMVRASRIHLYLEWKVNTNKPFSQATNFHMNFSISIKCTNKWMYYHIKLLCWQKRTFRITYIFDFRWPPFSIGRHSSNWDQMS